MATTNLSLTYITTWIKSNKLISAALVGVIALVVFPKQVKKLFGSRRKRRRRYYHKPVVRRSTHRSRVHHAITGTHRRTTRRRTTTGKKKPWQIKGSLAARRHMAKIRKRR